MSPAFPTRPSSESVANVVARGAVVAVRLVKGVVGLVAVGSGPSGGILAPLLILGGAAGALAGQLWLGHPGVWALVGMAGILSGAMRAPLTGADRKSVG